MFLTQKHLSRRTVLRGVGATIALPFLDSMIPARSVLAKTPAARAASRARLVCIEQVHGAAGCSEYGLAQNLWIPAATGRRFDISKGNLSPLEPFRNHLTIISNTDARMAEAQSAPEVGGDHFRSSAVMYTQAHPKLTEGSDVRVGTSMDQLYAQKFGQDTPIPSMQLSIEPVDQSGGCAYGYACVYTDTISWAAPDQPLPMVRDPRMVFEQLFGSGGTPEQRAAAPRDRPQHPRHADEPDGRPAAIAGTGRPAAPGSVLDQPPGDRAAHRAHRSPQHERRGARAAGRASGRAGCVRRTRQADVRSAGPRVLVGHDARVLVQDRAATVPAASIRAAASIAGSTTRRITARPRSASGSSARSTSTTSRCCPYFLEKLQSTMDGEANLLDKTLVLYGSPMAVGNTHNHRNCPLILLGRGGGVVEGGVHIKAAKDTPMANVMLTLLHRLGLEDLDSRSATAPASSRSRAPETTVA